MRKRRAKGKCRKCGKPARLKADNTVSTTCQDCYDKHQTKRAHDRLTAGGDYCTGWRLKLRLQVLMHYSHGTFTCSCCGEPDFRFLEIDHLNNDGLKHRRSIGAKTASHQLYKWLVDNNFPECYAVLCGNCNKGRAIYGVCPHKLRKLTKEQLALPIRELLLLMRVPL